MHRDCDNTEGGDQDYENTYGIEAEGRRQKGKIF
jgi:hypothetical protein